MSPKLSEGLDVASKLDRSRSFIRTLMDDGDKQARVFLECWSPQA